MSKYKVFRRKGGKWQVARETDSKEEAELLMQDINIMAIGKATKQAQKRGKPLSDTGYQHALSKAYIQFDPKG